MKKRFILFFICFGSLQTLRAQVVINEVMHYPSGDQGLIEYNNKVGKEYIELYNTSCSEAIDVSGYFLASRQEFSGTISGGAFRIPNISKAIIEPRGHLVIGTKNSSADMNSVDIQIPLFQSNYCQNGANFILANADGWLALYNPDGKPVDAIFWSSLASKISQSDDYGGKPCVPQGSPSGITSLFSAQQINSNFPSVLSYVGNSTNVGLTFSRMPDGEAWSRNVTPSINDLTTGNCNSGTCAEKIAIKLNATVKQPSCGGSDGEIAFAPTPTPTPTGSYTYTWTPTTIGNVAKGTSLKADTYKVVISNGGCKKDTTIVLSAPVPFKLNATVTQPTSCGTDDGAIAFAPTTNPTSTTTYFYTWPFPSTTNPSSVNNLKADSYKITITGNGCSKDTTIVLSAPNAPTLSATKTDPTTCASKGSISLSISPSTVNGKFDISYNGGNFSNVQITNGIGNILDVVAGTYNDLQIEVGGCKSPMGKAVTLVGPSAPTLSATPKQPVTCTDKGAIDFIFTGVNDGSTYVITYGTGLNFQNVLVSSNSATIQDLTANTYSDLQITVNGCTSALGVNVTINPPPASPSATATPKDAAKCLEKGSIELVLKNVPDASYDISYNGSQKFTAVQAISNVAIISYVELGTYNDLKFTANGCPVIVQPASLTISGPTPITGIEEKMLSPVCGAADGKITVMNVIGGSNPNFEYALDTVAFQTSPAFENLAAGNYTINVRDDKSCQFQKPIVLAPGNGNPTVFIPNVFTPNDDENDVNEVWNVSASCVKELNCQIFNRWGNLVHEITDPKGSWDGKDSAAGVYFYKLVVSSEGDKQENYHGYITLIR